MAAVEFVEKMDRSALKISEESYETFMEAAISDFNHQSENEESSLETSFNEKLDLAEAKAEEFFLKAKEVFKVTGERANQAISSLKESNLARKSMEKLNKFIKDFNVEKNEDEEGRKRKEVQVKREEEDFDTQLARAVSLSLLDEPDAEIDQEGRDSGKEQDEKPDKAPKTLQTHETYITEY